jgi:hypothetical protein
MEHRPFSMRIAHVANALDSGIECAIKAIIRHLATRSTGAKLEMKDLPPP